MIAQKSACEISTIPQVNATPIVLGSPRPSKAAAAKNRGLSGETDEYPIVSGRSKTRGIFTCGMLLISVPCSESRHQIAGGTLQADLPSDSRK